MDRANTICPFHHSSKGGGTKIIYFIQILLSFQQAFSNIMTMSGCGRELSEISYARHLAYQPNLPNITALDKPVISSR